VASIMCQALERGTFSHRHAVLHDQKSADRYVPLRNIFKTNPERKSEFFSVGPGRHCSPIGRIRYIASLAER